MNIIEEMPPLNEGFNQAMSELMKETQCAIENVLAEGKRKGEIRGDLDRASVKMNVLS